MEAVPGFADTNRAENGPSRPSRAPQPAAAAVTPVSREDADPVARSRALRAEFQMPPLGGRGQGGHGGGAGSRGAAPGRCGPRTSGPGDPVGPVPGLPRPPGCADPTMGYFCGAPGWNPGRAASARAKLRAPPGSDRRTLAPERKPRTGPPRAPRQDPGRHSPPRGPRRGLHRLPPPAGRAPAPSPCLRRPRAGGARPPGNATGRGACAPGAGPAEGRPPDSGLRNARRPPRAPPPGRPPAALCQPSGRDTCGWESGSPVTAMINVSPGLAFP